MEQSCANENKNNCFDCNEILAFCDKCELQVCSMSFALSFDLD